MNKKQLLKRTALFISLLYFSLYVPLAFTIYSQNWYEFNYEKQNTYEILGKENTTQITQNLQGFFIHRNNLDENWTVKEQIHYNDVRNIFDFLFIFAILSIMGLIIAFDKNKIKRYAKINIIIILSMFLLIPFFSYFWNNIFHNILFDNSFWIMQPDEISYYLFPLSFFKNSLIFIIFFALIFNSCIIILNKFIKK